ncbi:MAG: hypothetical protein CMJ87_05810 [Planctomycetes bacterium]|nr:hypothetical protein [Planctomycetota bacterium]
MKNIIHTLLITLAAASCSCASDDYGQYPPYQGGLEPSGQEGHVFINGMAMDQNQINEFQHAYGAAPMAGDYWYDQISGLYGASGQPPAGFMYPGHNFGQASEYASAGQSSIWFNGRRLTAQEVFYISALIGAQAQPGRYWFDAAGNVGFEGSPYTLGNLHAAARAGQARSAGGGDNFWSSSFSAGNSNASNTQGYVSVPGHGPVGYGF